MKRSTCLLLALFLFPTLTNAAEIGAGLNTSSASYGSYGLFRYDFGAEAEIVAGIYSKFSLIRIKNIVANQDKEFVETLSDKGEFGITLTKKALPFHGYGGLGAVFLQPDSHLLKKSAWGGNALLGIKFFIDKNVAFQIEQSVNFGLPKAKEVAGQPDLFNASTLSLGFLMQV